MARNLAQRLQMIRTQQSEPVSPELASTSRDCPPGPGWERLDRYCYRLVTDLEQTTVLSLTSSHPLFCREICCPDLQQLLFFDLETTGLSGGPGTAVFLAGFGQILGNTLRITQFFLADYPGEAAFYRELAAFIPANPWWVSYNGKSFDAPILRTKGALLGICFDFGCHSDLLHLSRRLWRWRLPDCSLSSIERYVLKHWRDNDLPGSMAPLVYFDYLKSGKTEELQRVITHHHRDIASLARLFSLYADLGQNPLLYPDADPAGLGTLLIDRPEGIRILERGFREGQKRCGIFLADFWRKQGRYSAAAALWITLIEDYADAPAGIALAKYHEHQLGDYATALYWARRVLQLKGTKTNAEDLDKRISRLERKLKAL